LIEIMAIGTAVRRIERMKPATAALIPQALIIERDTIESKRTLQDSRFSAVSVGRPRSTQRSCLTALAVWLVPIVFIILTIVIRVISRH
jgi:hypothetical protein